MPNQRTTAQRIAAAGELLEELGRGLVVLAVVCLVSLPALFHLLG